MRYKKLLAKGLSLSIVISVSMLLAACGAQNTMTTVAPEEPRGIYTNIQDFEDVQSRLVGSHAMLSERETVGEISTITVYSSPTAIELDENNNAKKDAAGEIIHVDNDDENNIFYKYIFSKDSIVAGESFLVYSRGQYTGYCTYDKETGRLEMYTPEYYMTYSTNAPTRAELDAWEGTATNTKVTEEVLANPNSGLNFASEWQHYHGNTLPGPMEVILLDNMEFNWVSQYLSEDASSGNNYSYEFVDYSYLYNDEENGGEN